MDVYEAFYIKIHLYIFADTCFIQYNCLTPLPIFDGGITEKDFFFTSEKKYSNCHIVKPPLEYIVFIKEKDIYTQHFDSTFHRIWFSQILCEKMVDVEPYYCCDNCNSDIITCLFIRIRRYLLVNASNKKVLILRVFVYQA